jgi:predicted PurR-regulated permease PerM
MQPISTSHPFVKVSLLIGSIVLALWVASFFPDLVLALIISALAAFILSPVVKVLEGRAGMRRVPAIITTFLTIGGTISYLLILLVPVLFDRFLAIHEQIKKFPFESKLLELTKGLESALPFVNGASLAQSIQGLIGQSADAAGSAIQNAFGTVLTLMIVPFFTYFILADGQRAYTLLIERIPTDTSR